MIVAYDMLSDMFNTTGYGKAVVKYIQAVKYVPNLLRSGLLDMWGLFLCQVQRFNLFCGASAPSEKTPLWSVGVCILWIVSFLTISGPPKPFAAVSAACGALLPQTKTLSWIVGACIV